MEAPISASAKPTLSGRLVEVDALRGIAAMAVVLFHLTTRFGEVFPQQARPAVALPYGHLGVNLFFIVSGFVIFMTLEKTRRPMDFVVSRFSRLYPVYWASVSLTFVITHWLGLPGFLVSLQSAIGNLLMFHGLFRIPHVDGVYWTLEVELLFYCGMLALFWAGQLGRIHQALLALLLLRLIYFAFERFLGIDLPWTIFRLLILKYIAWFALGICVYLWTSHPARGERLKVLLTSSAAIATLAVVDSLGTGLLALVLGGFVFLAASGRLAVLRTPVLVWLGAISYPLYLVHENIGWSLQLRLHALGMEPNLILVLGIAATCLLATLLNRMIELPAMRLIRQRYRKSHSGAAE